MWHFVSFQSVHGNEHPAQQTRTHGGGALLRLTESCVRRRLEHSFGNETSVRPCDESLATIPVEVQRRDHFIVYRVSVQGTQTHTESSGRPLIYTNRFGLHGWTWHRFTAFPTRRWPTNRGLSETTPLHKETPTPPGLKMPEPVEGEDSNGGVQTKHRQVERRPRSRQLLILRAVHRQIRK